MLVCTVIFEQIDFLSYTKQVWNNFKESVSKYVVANIKNKIEAVNLKHFFPILWEIYENNGIMLRMTKINLLQI